MKKARIAVALTVLVIAALTGLALGQDKPRVFVQGKGSQNLTASGSGGGGTHWGSWGGRSSLDSHDEAMEVTKDLQKDCSGVIVTLNQSNADYTVMLNRESKHNRGLLRTNSQVQVATRLGDILGTNSTRTVGNASKDACKLILSDWGQHGRTTVPDSPAPAPAAALVVPATEPPPAEAARAAIVPAAQPQPTTGVAGPNAATPAAATSSTVKLQIESIPLGADIEVDGNFVGNTPSYVQVSKEGHTVVVKKSGFKNWERKLKSSAGSSAHIVAELEKAGNP
jgi:PEGA domain